jgi:hypothetical protein
VQPLATSHLKRAHHSGGEAQPLRGSLEPLVAPVGLVAVAIPVGVRPSLLPDPQPQAHDGRAAAGAASDYNFGRMAVASFSSSDRDGRAWAGSTASRR